MADGHIQIDSTGTNEVYSGGTLYVEQPGIGLVLSNNAILALQSAVGTPGWLLLSNNVEATGSAAINSVDGNANAGTIDLAGAVRTFTVDAAYNLAISAAISDGGLTKQGTGTLTLSGANTYSAGTTISTGTLMVAADYAIPSNSTLYVDTLGVLDLGGHNTALSGFDGSRGAITNSTGTGNLTLNFASGTNTFYGTMSGAANFTLTGGGTLMMSGTNSFSGSTVVTNGSTYLVTGAHNGGVITAYTNSTVGGTGPIGSLVVNGGIYAPGLAAGTQTVQNLSLINGATLSMNIGANGYNSVIGVTNLVLQTAYLTLNLASYNWQTAPSSMVLVDWTAAGYAGFDTNSVFILNDPLSPDNGMILTNMEHFFAVGGSGATNDFFINYDDLANGLPGTSAITLNVVPEPGTASLLGLVGVVFVVRRFLRNRKKMANG